MTQTVIVVVVVWVLLSVAFVPCWAWALRHRRREERALEAAELVRAIELVQRRRRQHPQTAAASSTGGAVSSPRSTPTIAMPGASGTDDRCDTRGNAASRQPFRRIDLAPR